jgi:uncharacterized protein (DUF433 family)
MLGSLPGGTTFEESQRKYDIAADDIRAVLSYVTQLLG